MKFQKFSLTNCAVEIFFTAWTFFTPHKNLAYFETNFLCDSISKVWLLYQRCYSFGKQATNRHHCKAFVDFKGFDEAIFKAKGSSGKEP